MGLLTDLLLFPITGPIKGFRFILEQIRADALAHLENERKLIARLMQLNRQFDQGEIDETDFERQEQQILQQINDLRTQRQALVEQEMAIIHEAERPTGDPEPDLETAEQDTERNTDSEG